jgi:hypothetical protein
MLRWWWRAVNFSFFLSLAACRTRASACATRFRPCVRCVLCSFAFLLVAALGSTGSAAGAIFALALFVGFSATMAASDFSRSCTIGYGSSPSRCGPAAAAERSTVRPPGSRARSFCACQVLRPRRVFRALALTRPSVSPSAKRTASAPEKRPLSRLNGWPAHTPTDASLLPSRAAAHGSGPMRIATPSS